MGVEKKIIVLWICAMVVSSMLMEDGANAQAIISYPAMGRNVGRSCGYNNAKCIGKPANDYDRGCERFQRCRGGGGRKLMAIISRAQSQ
ncbi:hypothetical protein V6N13_088440 [Hibiscus sabdariffa]